MPGTPGVNGCALSCLVVNVNGMRSRNKRRGLFQRLRDLRYSIVVLCETHSTDDRETTRWAQEGAGPGLPWEGQAFWSHGTSSSRGVAILVRPGFFFWNLQDQKVHRYVGSSQLGTSRNQPLCSTPEMSNTRYHSSPPFRVMKGGS